MFALNVAVLAGVIYVLRRAEPRPIAILTPAARTLTAQPITVEIAGAVREPGRYALAGNARLADLIDRAGGVRADADLSALNLTRRLNDDDKILIPTRVPPTFIAADEPAPTAPSASSTAIPPTSAEASAKINLNTATLEELMTLPRIGETLAKRIIEYRQLYGPFKTIEDLKKVRGIGDALLAQIKERVRVE